MSDETVEIAKFILILGESFFMTNFAELLLPSARAHCTLCRCSVHTFTISMWNDSRVFFVGADCCVSTPTHTDTKYIFRHCSNEVPEPHWRKALNEWSSWSKLLDSVSLSLSHSQSVSQSVHLLALGYALCSSSYVVHRVTLNYDAERMHAVARWGARADELYIFIITHFPNCFYNFSDIFRRLIAQTMVRCCCRVSAIFTFRFVATTSFRT